jgi:hypothetical protein
MVAARVDVGCVWGEVVGFCVPCPKPDPAKVIAENSTKSRGHFILVLPLQHVRAVLQFSSKESCIDISKCDISNNDI